MCIRDRAWQSRLEEVSIRLFHEDRDWIFDHEDISLTTNLPELVEKAYLIGREGGLFARIKEIAGRKDNPLYFVSQTTYKTDALEMCIRDRGHTHRLSSRIRNHGYGKAAGCHVFLDVYKRQSAYSAKNRIPVRKCIENLPRMATKLPSSRFFLKKPARPSIPKATG